MYYTITRTILWHDIIYYDVICYSIVHYRLWSIISIHIAYTFQESTQVRDSAGVVLGDIQQKGMVRCSLDWPLPALVLCVSSPLKLPSLDADVYRLPTPGGQLARLARGRLPYGGPRSLTLKGRCIIYYYNMSYYAMLYYYNILSYCIM